MEPAYCIGLDVHKQKISYCVKDGSGKIRPTEAGGPSDQAPQFVPITQLVDQQSTLCGQARTALISRDSTST